MTFKYPVSFSTVAIAALLLGPSLAANAQSILLSAEEFVLLGGTVVTVAGAGPNTYSNGDVGSAAANPTGFPPATVVNGRVLDIAGSPADATTVGVALDDLITARNGLTAMVSPPANNLTGVNGGDLATQILAPGVYKFDVAASLSLNGVLTLDAGGKNNVVWVFNIGSSLTTGANAQIQFINLGTNGGKDNGLFWNAGTSITLGAENIIAGNYLAGETISFGTTVLGTNTSSGRALSLQGVTFNGPATMDVLGGPGNGDLTGGLALDGGAVVSAGYVLLSGDGTYVQGGSNVVLRPGTIYNTAGATVDGDSMDTVDSPPATLTVFQTIAALTGTNTYTGGTIVDAGTLTVATGNLPTDGDISLIDSNATGTAGALVFEQPTDGTFGGVISGAGSVTKEDAGVLTMTGANTYTGGTIVNGGTVIAASSSLPENGTVALALDTGLVFDQSAEGTFAGIISGDGSVTKENGGVLTVTGVNTYTGGTTINGGTVALSGDGTLGAATGDLVIDTGTLDLGGTSQTAGAVTLGGDGVIENGTLTGTSYTSTGGTVDAVLAGEGAFTNSSGTTTLTAENTYTGGTTVDGGTLVASTVILPTDGNVTLADGTTLVLNQTADGVYGGTITGSGTIVKQGSGGLMLTNSTDAEIDLQAGSLVLDGNSVGDTTLGAGTFLRGNGTVNGSLFNGGTVSAGFSPGTIIVAGNFVQTADGTLIIEIASPVSFDQLIVGGTASLAGTVQIDTLGGYDPVGEDFTVLTAAGGVSGTFDVQTGSAAVTALVVYNPNDVVISFAQTDFATFAGTPNQIAIANTAQQSPALTTALNGVPLASQMPAALNALSPQGYQIWSDIAFAHTASLGDRLARQPFATPGHDDFYFEAAQSRGRLSGDSDVGSSTYTSDSGLVGGNHAVGPNLTVGGFFEYTESTASLGSHGSHTTVKDKMPGVRAAWKQGAWFANAVAAYGFDDYESTRAINFPGTSATAKSKTKGHQWLVDVTGGRRFQTGPVSLSPFAGIQASGWKADSFTETGAGSFNATVDEQSARSLRTQLGLEAAFAFDIGAVVLRPHARAAWIHELANDHRSITGSIDGVAYSVETRDPQRDSARLSVGLDALLSPSIALYADYSIQTGHSSRVLGEWRAGLSIGF